MAFGGTGASNAGRGRRRVGYKPLSEINVTPFVDVMLVLLIVFMVAAPLLTVGIAVDLPETRAEALSDDIEPLQITVTANQEVYLQEALVAPENLVESLRAIAGAGYDERIYVRADKEVPYGFVAAIMADVTAAGFRRIALPTDQVTE